MVHIGSQKYKMMFKKFYFEFFKKPNLVNLFVNQWHFGSNKKLTT